MITTTQETTTTTSNNLNSLMLMYNNVGGNGKGDGNGNAYMEKIVSAARLMIAKSGLDPIQLPNAFVHIPLGQVGLFDGWVAGLSGIRRSGDAFLVMKLKESSFSGSVGITNLQVLRTGLG